MALKQIKEMQARRFLKKPVMTYRQCFLVAERFMKAGAVLGAKYSEDMDSFVRHFLGGNLPTGAAQAMLGDDLLDISWLLGTPVTFLQFIACEEAKILGMEDDVPAFLHRVVDIELPTDMVLARAWIYAKRGVAFGSILETVAQRMFEATRERADHGTEVASATWEEFETLEDAFFLMFCKVNGLS